MTEDKLIRFAIPSNGRMQIESRQFLAECGYKIRIRDRRYIGRLEPLTNVQLVLQRQKDIIKEIERGSLCFAIVGSDVLYEFRKSSNSDLIVIHDKLGFGKCRLEIAVPKEWPETSLEALIQTRSNLRIATKYPQIVKKYLQKYMTNFSIVYKHGSIEVAPALGYSDIIVDLVSSGETLRANNLRTIQNGEIFRSEAVLIGNRSLLKQPCHLEVARELLESFEGTLRGRKFVQIFANMRRSNPEHILTDLQTIPQAQGLQGPTISPVYQVSGERWHSIHIIVQKEQLKSVIQSLRTIGGSGVVVSSVDFIFEEEPQSYQQLTQLITEKETQAVLDNISDSQLEVSL